MPIFEFECPRCEHRFDDLLRSSTAPNPPCPKCKCVRTQRLMSTFAMGGRSSSESGHSHGGSCSCSGCSTPDAGTDVWTDGGHSDGGAGEVREAWADAAP